MRPLSEQVPALLMFCCLPQTVIRYIMKSALIRLHSVRTAICFHSSWRTPRKLSDVLLLYPGYERPAAFCPRPPPPTSSPASLFPAYLDIRTPRASRPTSRMITSLPSTTGSTWSSMPAPRRASGPKKRPPPACRKKDAVPSRPRWQSAPCVHRSALSDCCCLAAVAVSVEPRAEEHSASIVEGIARGAASAKKIQTRRTDLQAFDKESSTAAAAAAAAATVARAIVSGRSSTNLRPRPLLPRHCHRP